MSSELKVDNISEKTTNAGVQMGSALGLLSKTTTQMNAMSGMAAGDIIYNSTVGTIYVYNGSSWNAMSDNTFQFSVSWLVIAGGGAGGGSTPTYGAGGGGGAGGYRAAYASEASGGGASAESAISVTAGTSYTVTVGAGGAGVYGRNNGADGSDSFFSSIS